MYQEDEITNNLNKAKQLREMIRINDRRYVTISLTESGEESFKAIEEFMNSYYENIYSHIPDDKKDHVLESMEILLETISKI